LAPEAGRVADNNCGRIPDDDKSMRCCIETSASSSGASVEDGRRRPLLLVDVVADRRHNDFNLSVAGRFLETTGCRERSCLASSWFMVRFLLSAGSRWLLPLVVLEIVRGFPDN